MGFLDLTGELLGQVDFEKSEIIQPRKLVFVCGGKSTGNHGAPGSLRELILHKAAASGKAGVFGDANVLLAEDAMNALANTNFRNLLDLEEFIAAVVHAVILIVESPGSMCELGAFVKTTEIRGKLIVVLPSDQINTPSFITKGAIAYLKEYDPNAPVLGFHWNTKDGVVTAPDYAVEQILADIPDAMKLAHKAHAKEAFSEHKRGHRIYLTLAFCHLLRAAKLIDIKSCFAAAGIAIDEIEIKRCLDTLLICKLLKKVENGRLAYHVARVDRIPLEIAFKKDAPDRDRNSMRIVTRIVQEIEKEDPVRTQMFREHHNG